MSFGASVGDIIAVGTLAWDIYRKCNGLSDEFKDVCNEALTAHTVIRELQDEAQDEASLLNVQGVTRKPELMQLIHNLEEVLRDLDAFVKKYEGQSRRERRIFNQFKLATEDLGRFRGKLSLHLTAINTFTQSLSRGNLARIEVVLLELVREVREGRRPPSIASVDKRIDNSGWRELEAELVEDGVSSKDISKNKIAIKTFVQNLLNSSDTDSMSLYDFASVVESRNDGEDLESPRHHMPTLSISSGSFSWESGMEELNVTSSKTLESGSTVCLLPQEDIPIAPPPVPPRPAIKPVTRPTTLFATLGKPPKNTLRRTEEISKCPDLPVVSDGSIGKTNNDYVVETTQIGPRKKVLLLDQSHSCVSKLAHAYMQSLMKSHSIIREQFESVQSAGWRTDRSRELERWSLDVLVKDLLIREKLEIPRWTRAAATFQYEDAFKFDNIICFNASSLQQTFEDYLRSCKRRFETEGSVNKKFARLTRYDFPAFLQIPESMFRIRDSSEEFFPTRQKIALDAIWRAVQTFILGFLEESYGLKRAGPNLEGFEKVSVSR